MLTAIPCFDVSNDNGLQKTEQSQKTTDNQQNDSDHCSPFCTCYCCVSPIYNLVLTIQIGNFSFALKYPCQYQSRIISSICATIWQPPKLS